MKPLVLYCRWHDASLRLRGREETAVWGHLVFIDENKGERLQLFRYNLNTRQLTLKMENGEEQIVQLDEMGVVKTA